MTSLLNSRLSRPAREGGFYRRAALLSLGLGLGLALMMNGALATPYREIAFLALAPGLAMAACVRLKSAATARVLRWSMGALAALGTWVFAQSVALPFDALTHPVWATLAEEGIATGHYISVAPGQTRAALPALILPGLVFAAMLLLCQRSRDAVFAWWMLAWLGVAMAALSVVLELGFAGETFFSTAPIGRGAFSGVFANRNVTAAFLALASLTLAGAMLLSARKRAALSPAQIALAALLFLMVIALIVTRSRAGVGLGLAGLTVCFGAHVAWHSDSLRRAWLVALAGLAVVLAFGEPVLSRLHAGESGLRLCAWRGTWLAIMDRPWTGTGFANFAEVFPQYRDPECLGTEGWWDRAHNSYLEFVAGTGVIGLALLLAVLAGLGRVLIAGIRHRQSLRPIPLFTAGALGVVLLHSAADFPLQVPGVALYAAALAGVGCAVSLFERPSAAAARENTV